MEIAERVYETGKGWIPIRWIKEAGHNANTDRPI